MFAFSTKRTFLYRSQRSLRLKGSPIHAKVQLKDCMDTVHKIKTEKGVQNVEIQSTARPKKTHRARKSTGIKKKYALPQKSGKSENINLNMQAKPVFL